MTCGHVAVFTFDANFGVEEEAFRRPRCCGERSMDRVCVREQASEVTLDNHALQADA